MTNGKGGTEANIKARIAKARAAFNQLRKYGEPARFQERLN